MTSPSLLLRSASFFPAPAFFSFLLERGAHIQRLDEHLLFFAFSTTGMFGPPIKTILSLSFLLVPCFSIFHGGP